MDLRALRLEAASLALSAEGVVRGTTFEGTIEADVEDMAQLAPLTGADLGGALEARAEGSASPLTGAFDMRLTGTGRDLTTGIEAADALIGGRADLVVDAARDVEGTEIRTFTIETAALQASVEGRVAPEDPETSVDVTYSARLDDVGRLTDQVSGPATLSGTARREGPLGAGDEAPGRWEVTLDAEAPEQGTVTLQATVPDEGTAEARFDASVADLGAYVPQLPGRAEIVGTATREGGDWNARATADLPQDVTARVSATLPEEGEAMANFDARRGRSGRLRAAASRHGHGDGPRHAPRGQRRRRGHGDGRAAAGHRGRDHGERSRRRAGDGGVRRPRGRPRRLHRGAAGPRDAHRHRHARRGRHHRRLRSRRAPGESRRRSRRACPQRAPRWPSSRRRWPMSASSPTSWKAPPRSTGTAIRSDGETVVDARMEGPEGLVATVDATLMGEAIRADLDAQLPDVGILTGALSGPATIDASILREGGETTATMSVDGPEGITAEIDATLPAEGPIAATYEARIADVSALAPLPEGPATLAGTAERTPEGDLSTDARLTAPAGIEADVTASLLASGDIDARLDAAIAEPGAIREGLPGPIDALVTASRADGAWTAEADVTAPGDARLALDVSLPPEGDAAIEFDLRLADPAPYLNGLPGPLTATGTARRDEAGWTAEVDASAADGSRIVADATVPDEGRAEVTFDAAVGDLGRFVPQLPGEATARGTATREGGTWSAQAEVTAPAGIEATVEGSLAEGGDAEVTFDAAIGELGRFVPQLPGAATAQGTVTRQAGAFGIDVEASGPQGTRAVIDGHLRPRGRRGRRLRRGARGRGGLRAAPERPGGGAGHAARRGGRQRARDRRGAPGAGRLPGGPGRHGGARLRHRRPLGLRHRSAGAGQPVRPPARDRGARALRPLARRPAGAGLAVGDGELAGRAAGAARPARRGGGDRRGDPTHGWSRRARRHGRAELGRAARRHRARSR